MEYRGYVENGVIRSSETLTLPDGTEVEFHPIDGGNAAPLGRSGREAELSASTERFWRSESLEALLSRSGIKPIADARELAGDWPAEDDIDEFLRTLREWRR